ncbi:xanthine dehydrogenase-like [Gigantopelta aegis]|uniref:xanthine dehydrogenase-like n=1 Tax=Gigantopelta aegis TaxID=1735272 RepID=UPI001B88D584|nr:xanthine dehydrogenase-like [Gigantopelta aegis]
MDTNEKTSDKVVTCPVCSASLLPQSGSLKNGIYATTCENCGHFIKFRCTGPVKSDVKFTINGQSYTIGNQYSGALSLNEWLRRAGVSFGTKVMCMEGGCGVCLVTAKLYDPVSMSEKVFSVNSCLVPLYTCDGWEITTIEGLGDPITGLNPVQKRLASYNGSQCGFCSPAQVMNMHGLLQRVPKPTMQEVEDTFDTSICRCTGYRSILDAMKSFASDAPPHLPGGPIDIEEVDQQLCKKTGQPCSGQCSGHGSLPPLHMVLQDTQWFRPTSKSELFAIIKQVETKNYRLVFGNTGYGVYKDIGPWMYDILIDLRGIKEFYAISFDTTVLFGASLTLSNLLNIFQKSKSDPTLTYFKCLAKHLARVANTGVRNLGCWAGNLMLKHAHPEFVSDIFVMLETVGTKLIVGGPDHSDVNLTLTDFLKTDMKGKVITLAVLPTYQPSDNMYIRTFKVMPRNQNAHAYVSAGFRMQIDKATNYTVTLKPSIVMNGISKTFNHAVLTENYLVGKQLGDPNVLKGALGMLASELIPDASSLTDTNYIKSLALSLFYKFVLGACDTKVSPRYKSGGANLYRPLSSGTQSYDTHKQEWPVSEPMTKTTSELQTSGRVQFVNDVPPQSGELHAAFVLSSVGKAQISNVDTSAALSLPGVLKYLSAADIPPGGKNNYTPTGEFVEEIFSSGEIQFCGQPIGLIVAVDQLTADTAASMVKVTYTNVHPPVLTMVEAIQQGSVFPHVAEEIKVGDAEAAIAASPKKILGQISMESQYHFQMETQISICSPTEDGVGMNVLAATQWIDYVQQVVAGVLNIPESGVNVSVRRLGGAYGSKITRNNQISAACALAAHIMRKPVRLFLNFHDNMKAIGKRFPYLADYQIGVSNEGRLNGIKITVNADCGFSPNDQILSGLFYWLDNAYYCPNWYYIPVALKTNKPSNTSARSPGSCPAVFIMESMMEHIAKCLDKDPLEIRKLNLYQKGQKTPGGMVLNYCNLTSLVSQLELSADVVNRKKQIAAFNQANKWKKKGLSVVPLKFGIGWATATYNVFLTIYHGDGTVAIAHGGVESGQGINTKVSQVCAYELGIAMDTIKIKQDSTLANANSQTTGGSITSELCCLGVIECCKMLKQRMAPVKAKMVDPTWKQLVAKCFQEGVDLSARYFTNETDSSVFHYNVYGVTCTEMELDVLTGENQITSVDMLYDCGESINPEIDIGQAEGAFVMGLGYWLLEKLQFDSKTGENLTAGTWEYKPPMGKDIPISFNIKFLKNAPNPLGVLRSKAVGEPPLCMSCSALFGLKHAMEAARRDISKDVFFALNAPATVEAVQLQCLVDPSQMVYGP